jgi:hypothetical protein
MFPWGRFILAVRDRHPADQNEIAVVRYGVTTKDYRHEMLLHRLRRITAFLGDQRSLLVRPLIPCPNHRLLQFYF